MLSDRKTFKPSELILNPDGSIYHLNLLPHELANVIILVGDPDRVPCVSAHFDDIEVKKAKREFVTHTGFIGSKRLTVMSTGIGAENIDIVMNECDALMNIDFETRTVKSKHYPLQFIRLGTCGALSKTVEPGQLIVSEYAIGLDGLMMYYQLPEDQKVKTFLTACHAQFHEFPSVKQLYASIGDAFWIDQFVQRASCIRGITMTCPGFYGPQHRQLRMPLSDIDVIGMMRDWQYDEISIINLEMETAAIYALARMFGHQACSISAVVANRVTQTFAADIQLIIERMIESALLVIDNV